MSVAETSVSGSKGQIAQVLREAVACTDPNVLRVALIQNTGDRDLAEMKLHPVSMRGGSLTKLELGSEDVAIVVRKAAEFLARPDRRDNGRPDDDHLRHLVEVMEDRPITDAEYAFRKPILAFDDLPRAASWTDEAPNTRTHEVAIIGAGFSGVAMAVQLRHLGIPFRIYERRSEAGGTWSINTYPSARVDTLSAGYQFSFVKNYPWSEYYATQREVRAYIDHVIDTFGLAEFLELDADVTSATFDESSKTWRLTIRSGDVDRDVTARYIVAASGVFAVPRQLSAPGVETFAGPLIHTTSWDASVDLTGKNVAVVGNGSTGVQLLQAVAEKAASVAVYQRTPQWMLPRENYGAPIPPSLQWLIDNVPHYWNWYVYTSVTYLLGAQNMQEPDPEWKARGGRVSRLNDDYRAALESYIRDQVEGREDLASRLIPNYAPMARRLVADNNWYRTLLRDHVELVTTPIDAIGPDSIASGGQTRPTDVIIAATGFDVERYLWPTEFFGTGGKRLRDVWEREPGPTAYLGMAVPDFPNLFIMYGPNAQPRTGESTQSWIECWTKYIADCIIATVERGAASIEVTFGALQRYADDVDELSNALIWADPDAAERNYYVNSYGRQQVVAPWRAEDYFALLSRPDLADFIIKGDAK